MPALVAQTIAVPGSVPVDLEKHALESWEARRTAARVRRFKDLDLEMSGRPKSDDGLTLDEKIERDELRELYARELSRLLEEGLLPLDFEPETEDATSATTGDLAAELRASRISNDNARLSERWTARRHTLEAQGRAAAAGSTTGDVIDAPARDEDPAMVEHSDADGERAALDESTSGDVDALATKDVYYADLATKAMTEVQHHPTWPTNAASVRKALGIVLGGKPPISEGHWRKYYLARPAVVKVIRARPSFAHIVANR